MIFIKDMQNEITKKEKLMPNKDEVKKYYKEKQAGMVLSPRKIWLLNKMSHLIAPTDSVLDVGCGDGMMTIGMKCYSENITGCDLDVEQVQKALPHIDFFLLDLAVKPHPDCFVSNFNQHNIVTLFDVLEHISEEDEVQALRNCLKRTKDFLVINTPIGKHDDQIMEREVNIDNVIKFLIHHMYLHHFEKHEAGVYAFMIWRKIK